MVGQRLKAWVVGLWEVVIQGTQNGELLGVLASLLLYRVGLAPSLGLGLEKRRQAKKKVLAVVAT